MEEEKLKLSQDITVAVQIYEDTIIKKEPAYPQKIAKETGLDKKAVDYSIIKLWYDYHCLESEVRIVDGCRTLCFNLNHTLFGYIKGLYNTANSNNENEDVIEGIEILSNKNR